jgi:hypothetical protein
LSDAELERISKQTGFITRNNKLTAKDFLRMLLFDHLKIDKPSLQQHALEVHADSGKKVSKQAIDKKLNSSCVDFIKAIFEKFLSVKIEGERMLTDLDKKYTAIRVMDSTEFKLPDHFENDFPGYSKCNAPACAAIQFEYDILSKKINCMSLSSARASDKTYADEQMHTVNAGELIIRDLGYYSVESYNKIERQNAFYVSRLKPGINISMKHNKEFKTISWSDIIKLIKRSKNNHIDHIVYLGAEQKKEVRLMGWLIAESEQQKRLERKRYKKGHISSDDTIRSQVNLFITNIPTAELTMEQAYKLYKIRWQIELLFKIWKSILKIHVVKKMKPERLKCYLYSKFIWILLCWDITISLECIVWKKFKELISFYKCFQLLKDRSAAFKIILLGNQKKIKNLLQKVLQTFIDYGLKDNKKGKIKLKDLLQLT